MSDRNKHTAGPWVVGLSGVVEAKCAIPLCYKHAPRDGRDPVCFTSGYFGSYQQAANATLIASAPELLDLLDEARTTLEMWKDVAPAVSLCADIDKLLAKARGES